MNQSNNNNNNNNSEKSQLDYFPRLKLACATFDIQVLGQNHVTLQLREIMRYMCRLHPITYVDHPHKTTNVTEALMFRIPSEYIIFDVILCDHQLQVI